MMYLKIGAVINVVMDSTFKEGMIVLNASKRETCRLNLKTKLLNQLLGNVKIVNIQIMLILISVLNAIQKTQIIQKVIKMELMIIFGHVSVDLNIIWPIINIVINANNKTQI